MLRHDVELASVGSEALPLADLVDFFSAVCEAYYIAHPPNAYAAWDGVSGPSIVIQGRVK